MTEKTANWKPPIPPPDTLAQAPITMSGIALKYWIEHAFTGESLPRARCKGCAPRFDPEALPRETRAEFTERITWAQQQCRICPENPRCAYTLEGSIQ